MTVAVAGQPSGRSGGARRGAGNGEGAIRRPWVEQLAAAVRCCWCPRALASRPLPKVPALLTPPSPRETRAPGQWLCGAGGWGWAGPRRRVASLPGRGGGGGRSRQQLTASPRYVLLQPRCVFKEGLFRNKVRCGEFDGSLVPEATDRPVAHCPVHHALNWSAADRCTFPQEQPCSLGTLQEEIALWDSPWGRRLSAVASTPQPGGVCLAAVPTWFNQCTVE